MATQSRGHGTPAFRTLESEVCNLGRIRICSFASSSIGRSSPRWCPSSSPCAAASRWCRCRSAQYPQITHAPSVSLSITYPGGNAQVVQDTIAAPVEQAVNGVQGMLAMSSTSGSDGSYSLSITFEVGTNLNTALVMVQKSRGAGPCRSCPTQVQEIPGDHRPQEIAGPADDHPLLLQRSRLHRPRSEQFRPHQSQGRAAPRAGRLRREHHGRTRLRHPDLARSAETGVARHDGPWTWPPPCATRASRRHPGRPGNLRPPSDS